MFFEGTIKGWDYERKQEMKNYAKKTVPPGKPLVGRYVGMLRGTDSMIYAAKILSAKESNGVNHITYKIFSGKDKGLKFTGRYDKQSVFVFKTKVACGKHFGIDLGVVTDSIKRKKNEDSMDK